MWISPAQRWPAKHSGEPQVAQKPRSTPGEEAYCFGAPFSHVTAAVS